MLTLLLACTPTPTAVVPTPAPAEVDWAPGLPPLERGLRTITHLHSPYSHDACDDEGLIDGEPNQDCLDDLRDGLCTAGIDVAFLSDHPSHAAEPDFDALFHARPGDTRDGKTNLMDCGDRTVQWYAGFEDDLMPLGMDQHVPGTATEREALLNQSDAAAMTAMIDAGASVYMAHTEGRDLNDLMTHQDNGMVGVEIWSLHAMFAPDIRQEFLGLDGIGWFEDIGPFLAPDAKAEPDLLVLGVLQLQAISLEKFDALAARGPVVGILGTDAHQNVLPLMLRDGDRVDSYRRMLRWMANIVLPQGEETAQEALAAGRSFVAFEILGTPSGFDFTAADGTTMGGSTTSSTLEIGCPTLHPQSPRGPDEPEIEVNLLRDGEVVATGCGTHTVEPGVHRVEIFQTPHHLRRFLGDDPDSWIRSYPWLLSNPIWVN